jgi:preprotein translocase subunit SecB
MKPSPLHLEGYHIAEFFFKLNESFQNKTPFGSWTGYHYSADKSWKVESTDFKIDADLYEKIDDASRIRYVLTISSASRKDKVPYSFRISIVGYFHIDKSFPEKEAYLLIYASAPSLLYGAAREMLAMMTGRGPYPAVILPTATFYDDAVRAAKETPKEVRAGKPKMKQIGAGKKAARKKTVARAKKRS